MSESAGNAATNPTGGAAGSNGQDEGFHTPPTGLENLDDAKGGVDGASGGKTDDDAEGLDQDELDKLLAGDDGDEDGKEPGEEAEDGLVDVELEDGRKVRVDPELKAGYERTKDYTAKTTALAERTSAVDFQAKALAARQAELDVQNQLVETRSGLVAKQAELKHLETQIDYLDGLNWARLEAKAQQAKADGDDSEQTRLDQLWVQRKELKDRRSALAGEIETAEGQVQSKLKEAGELATKNQTEAIQRGDMELTKAIPQWTERRVEILKFGAERFGFTGEELVNAVADPRMIRVLHQAQLGLKAQEENKTLRKALRATRGGAPAQTVGGGKQGGPTVSTTSPKSDAKSTKDWMESERKRLAGKQQR